MVTYSVHPHQSSHFTPVKREKMPLLQWELGCSETSVQIWKRGNEKAEPSLSLESQAGGNQCGSALEERRENPPRTLEDGDLPAGQWVCVGMAGSAAPVEGPLTGRSTPSYDSMHITVARSESWGVGVIYSAFESSTTKDRFAVSRAPIKKPLWDPRPQHSDSLQPTGGPPKLGGGAHKCW